MKKAIAAIVLLLIVSALPAQELPQIKKGGAHGRGYVLPSKEARAVLHKAALARHGWRMHRHVQAMTAPSAFDSRTLGWIPPMRDQGQCGDCFGVSASDALSIAYIKAGQQKADGSFVISEQYGLDCRAYPGGCNGGDGPQVYDIMKGKGFPAEKYLDPTGKSVSDYPAYTARPSSCRLNSNAKMWKCDDWGYVTSDQSDRAPTAAEVKAGVMNYGCVTFAFDAGGLDSMKNNIVVRLGSSIDHEITGFVGWDDSKACPDGSKGAFICRNQWGQDFGDGGYFWLPYSQLPHIVEACFLTVTALPPPPPPPTPPAPPGPAGLVYGTGTLADGTRFQMVPDGMEIFPAGTKAKLDLINAKMKELEALLNPPKSKEPPKAEEKKQTKVNFPPNLDIEERIRYIERYYPQLAKIKK